MAVKNAARPSARERLLASANELFYEDGVHTVGIDRVIEHAGVAKGSLYNTFGSKDELIRAYLESRHASMEQRFGRALERYDSPRDRLLGVFDVQAELFSEPGYRGCAFARASAESHPGDLVEQATADYRAWVRSLFTRLAEEAGVPDAPGPGPPSSTCSTTAAAWPPGWTTTRRQPRQPASQPPPCSTRPSPPPRPTPKARRPGTDPPCAWAGGLVRQDGQPQLPQAHRVADDLDRRDPAVGADLEGQHDLQPASGREHDAHRAVHQGQPGLPGPGRGRDRAPGYRVRAPEQHRAGRTRPPWRHRPA